MYLLFAWRYFKGKKTANAINIISWVTTGVIAFATCCQVLVLSVFNGFEDLVKSLYSSFYTDLKIVPAKGKTFFLSPEQVANIRGHTGIYDVSMIAEEKALLKNEDAQSVIYVKGVDENFNRVSGVPNKLTKGKFNTGTQDQPNIIVGSGIQNATGVMMNDEFASPYLTLILPKKNDAGNDPFQSLSEGNVTATGVFAIQQDFDNKYAITNIAFVKRQMGLAENEYTAAEIRLKYGINMDDSRLSLQNVLGGNYNVQTKYQQNSNLYNTMSLEKWAIYAVLTLILVIAAFNMVSALTMLVLEKKRDIAVLQSMGSTRLQIKKIFLSEGILLAGLGAGGGIILATLICLIQLQFKVIKLKGGSFLIDYFPVKLMAADFLLVAGTSVAIALLASWYPASKASRQPLDLR